MTVDQRAQDGRGLVGVLSDAFKSLRLLLDRDLVALSAKLSPSPPSGSR